MHGLDKCCAADKRVCWLVAYDNCSHECVPDCVRGRLIFDHGRCSALRGSYGFQHRSALRSSAVAVSRFRESMWPDRVEADQESIRCITPNQQLRNFAAGEGLKEWFRLLTQSLSQPKYLKPQGNGHFPSWAGCFGCRHGNACCSGNGRCAMGVCMCAPGFGGLDCATLLEPAVRSPPPPTATAAGLRIYIYEDLPADLSLVDFANHMWRGHCSLNGKGIYSASWMFLDALLRDGSVRTTNGEEADLYLVPLHHCQIRICQRALLHLALAYVQARHPWFNRSGGRDHVTFLSPDKGGCGLGATATKLIVVSHWGWLGTNTRWKSFPNWDESEGGWRRSYRNRSWIDLSSSGWCHQPHKDLVIPPSTGGTPADPNYLRQAKHLLVHAGGVYGWNNYGKKEITSYSLGMRQALWLRYGGADEPHDGILVSNLSVAERTWRQASFCYAPAGHGWGTRVTEHAMRNCLPLVAQPYVVQPFEGLLGYDRFAARVDAIEDVDRLASLLSAVAASPAKLGAMRRALHAVAPAFSWDLASGGLAYNYTLLGLCYRAVELRGALRAQRASCATLADRLPEAGVALQLPSWAPTALKEATFGAQRRRLAWMQRRARSEE